MTRSRYVVYEERTPWPLWVQALLLATCVGPGLWLVVAGVVGVDPGRTAAGGALLATVVVLRGLFGSLTTRVTRTHLFLLYGRWGVLTRSVWFEEVARMEAVTYRPLRDFGGWGIRVNRRGARAWTVSGDRALRIESKNGQVFYLGSPDPERLLERIRMVAERRFDEEGRARP